MKITKRKFTNKGIKLKITGIFSTVLLLASPLTSTFTAFYQTEQVQASNVWDRETDPSNSNDYDQLLQNAGPADAIVDWYPTKDALGPDPSGQDLVKQLIDLSIATNDSTSITRKILFNDTTGSNSNASYRDVYDKYNLAFGFIAQILNSKGIGSGIGLNLKQGAKTSSKDQDPLNDSGKSVVSGRVTEKPGIGEGVNVSDVLGTAFFGNPEDGYAQIYVNGYDNVAQSEANIIREATSSITIVAGSKGTGKKATAIFKLNNRTLPVGVSNSKLNNYVDDSVYALDSTSKDVAGLNLTTASQNFINQLDFSKTPKFWVTGNDGSGTIVVPRGTTAKQIAELISKRQIAGNNTLDESAPMKAVQAATAPGEPDAKNPIAGTNKKWEDVSYSHFYEGTQKNKIGSDEVGVPWANNRLAGGAVDSRYNNALSVHSGIDGPESFNDNSTISGWETRLKTKQYREYNNVFNTNEGIKTNDSIELYPGNTLSPVFITDPNNKPTTDGWFGGNDHLIDTNKLFNNGNWTTKSASSLPDVKTSEGSPFEETKRQNDLLPAKNMNQDVNVAGTSDHTKSSNIGKVKHLFTPSSYFKESYDANHFVTNSPELQDSNVDSIAKSISSNGSFNDKSADGQIQKSFTYEAPVSSWIYKSYDNPYSTVMSSAGAQTTDGEPLKEDNSNSTIKPQEWLDLDDPNNPEATKGIHIGAQKGTAYSKQTDRVEPADGYGDTYFYAGVYPTNKPAGDPDSTLKIPFPDEGGRTNRWIRFGSGSAGTLVKYGAVGTDGEDVENDETQGVPTVSGSSGFGIDFITGGTGGTSYNMNRIVNGVTYPNSSGITNILNKDGNNFSNIHIWDDSQYFVQTWDKNTTVKDDNGNRTLNVKPLIYNKNVSFDRDSIGKVDSPNFEAKYYLAGYVRFYSGAPGSVAFYLLGDHINQTKASKRAYYNSNLYNNPSGEFSKGNAAHKNNSRFFVSQDFSIGPVSSDMINDPGGDDLTLNGVTYPAKKDSPGATPEENAEKILKLAVLYNDPTQNPNNKAADPSVKAEFTDSGTDGNGHGTDGTGYKLVTIADAARKQGITEDELAAEVAKVTKKNPNTVKHTKWVEATLPRIKQNAGRARINVVIYDKAAVSAPDDNKPTEPVKPTKPSFSVTDVSQGNDPFNSQLSPYTTTYDDGAVLKAGDVPQSFKNLLLNTLVAGNPDFTGSPEKTKQLLVGAFLDSWQQNNRAGSSLYLYGGFGISNTDSKHSYDRWPTGFDSNTGDYQTAITRFPGNFYRGVQDLKLVDGKSSIKGISADSLTADVSKLDLSKAGTYPVVFTYTNPDNKDSKSSITVPITVADQSAPIFTFQNSDDSTIYVGDNFDPNSGFKVVGSWSIFHQYQGNYNSIQNYAGIARDAKGNPEVSVTGSVNTLRPGIYQLTYKATNTSGLTTTMVRNITVLPRETTGDWKATPLKAIGYINYVPGYGIMVYDAPAGNKTGQRLAHGSSWKISQKAINAKGEIFYRVGRNQWINGKYVSFSPIDSFIPLKGEVTIVYEKGYGVNLWKSAGTSGGFYPERKLMTDTRWKTSGKQNGFYKVGKDQWIQGDYASFKSY